MNEEQLQQLLQAREDTLSLAQLYDKKRAEGMDKPTADAYVSQIQRSRQSPQPTQSGEPVGMAEGLAKTAVHGATLGFADELVGLGGAVLGPLAGALGGRRGGETFGERYRTFRDDAREDLEGFKEAHPVAATTADLAGGLLIPGGIAANLGRRAGMGVAGKAAVSAVEGAAVGGAAGLGHAEEGNLVHGTLTGAVGGAAVGGAIPLAGAVGGAAYNLAGRPNPLRSAGSKADDLIVNAMRDDRSTVDDALLRLMDERDLQGNVVRPAAYDQDTPIGLLDLFGNNILRLGRGAVSAGDEVTDQLPKLLRDRVETQQGRILNKVQDASGVQHRSIYGTKDAILKSRSEQSDPFYNQLNTVGKVDDPEVDALLALPKVRGTYNAGVRSFKKATDEPIPQIARASTGAPMNEGEVAKLFEHWKAGNPNVAKQLGEVPNKREFLQQAGWLRPDGALTEDVPFAVLRERFQSIGRDGQNEANRIARLPAAKGLHYTKRMMDDAISSMKRRGRKEQARELVQLQRQLVGRMDELLKNEKGEAFYKKGREIFAGESALLDALDEGRKFFNMHPEEIGRYLAELTEGEREMFLLGGIDVISEVMMKTADNKNLYGKVFGNDWKRKQIQSLFGENTTGFDQFQRMMDAENLMAKNMNFVTGGSNTVDKAGDLAKLVGMSPLDLAVQATGGGGLSSVIATLLPAALRGRKEGVNKKIADELGTRLAKGMSGDRDELIQYLISLQGRERRKEVSSELGAAVRRALEGEIGELLGTN